MDRQEKKIMELAEADDEVIVLEPRKHQSFARLIITEFMNLPFTSKEALAERVRENSYFLIRNDEKNTLYSMNDDLGYDSYDVTEAIKESTDRNSFVFMGYKFKYVEIIE